MQFVLYSRDQQAIRTAHLSPVVFVGGSTGETNLIVATVLVDTRPGKTMRATLTKKKLQQFHELT